MDRYAVRSQNVQGTPKISRLFGDPAAHCRNASLSDTIGLKLFALPKLQTPPHCGHLTLT